MTTHATGNDSYRSDVSGIEDDPTPPLPLPEPTRTRFGWLVQIKRTLVACFVVAFLASLPIAAQHAAAVPSLSGQTDARTYGWTPALAARFPQCAAHVPGVASAFVVERLDGSIERMAFDEAWTRNHNESHADDVWVRGQCR